MHRMLLSSSIMRKTRHCIAVLVAALLPASSFPQSAGTDSLSGVWGAEVRFGIPAQGDLLLDEHEGVWHASIAGYQVSAEKKGDEIRFTLPDNSAEFRGIFESPMNSIRGEWIQQGGVILDQQYASPIELRSIAPSCWRGIVVPLEQRVSMYLFLSSKEGKMTATISNPEGNFFRRRIYVVTQDGDRLSLESNGKKIEGRLDDKTHSISLELVDWLPAIQFTHRTAKDAVGFYPRTPADQRKWCYRKPLTEGDGWTTASMHAEGLAEAPIGELIRRILSADPTSTVLKIQSLLIARHGRLVLEEYFYGFSEDRVHDMRSAGKTFAPTLLGLARERGASLTPQMPIYPLFTQYGSFANWDTRKHKITLRDLMTMTAGSACDDNNDESPGNEDRMQSDEKQRDWYKYSLDLPMLKDPGGNEAVYCSGDLNLAGGAVAAATHRWLPQFFDETLARPLQFGRYYLNLMPDGQAYMGGGAYLRPRDQLKLGQLYLDGGRWNGKRIVSKEWVGESTSVHSHFAAKYSLGQQHNYGYGWHIHDLNSGAKTFRVFAAEGNGGQFVIVVPDLDLVVGITGGSYGEFDQWYRWELELVPQFIIPAAGSSHSRYARHHAALHNIGPGKWDGRSF
jgi:CubicO group peptidase (beta-lactamase class C family)